MINYSSEENEPHSMIIESGESNGVIKKIGERVRSFKSPIKIKFRKEEEN
jgi:hypothetical protein